MRRVPSTGEPWRHQARAAAAVVDARVVERFQQKVVIVPGSECLWWVGGISGRGHGRFWVAGDLVMIAHRFAYAVEVGIDELEAASVLGHGCDNPLCQRVGPGHVMASSTRGNRRDYEARRVVAGSPLGDPRGSWRRAQVLRDLAKEDPAAVAADLELARQIEGYQLSMW